MTVIEIPDELIDVLQPGTVVRVHYNENNINNELRHIRGIVDDDQIVYRVWSKRKQTWRYHVEWIYAFHLLFKDGHLSKA